MAANYKGATFKSVDMVEFNGSIRLRRIFTLRVAPRTTECDATVVYTDEEIPLKFMFPDTLEYSDYLINSTSVHTFTHSQPLQPEIAKYEKYERSGSSRIAFGSKVAEGLEPTNTVKVKSAASVRVGDGGFVSASRSRSGSASVEPMKSIARKASVPIVAKAAEKKVPEKTVMVKQVEDVKKKIVNAPLLKIRNAPLKSVEHVVNHEPLQPELYVEPKSNVPTTLQHQLTKIKPVHIHTKIPTPTLRTKTPTIEPKRKPYNPDEYTDEDFLVHTPVQVAEDAAVVFEAFDELEMGKCLEVSPSFDESRDSIDETQETSQNDAREAGYNDAEVHKAEEEMFDHSSEVERSRNSSASPSISTLHTDSHQVVPIDEHALDKSAKDTGNESVDLDEIEDSLKIMRMMSGSTNRYMFTVSQLALTSRAKEDIAGTHSVDGVLSQITSMLENVSTETLEAFDVSGDEEDETVELTFDERQKCFYSQNDDKYYEII